MIFYQSTRGDKKLNSFSEVILEGIAKDGGLFVPESLPKLSLKQLNLLVGNSYYELAEFIFNLFQTDFSAKDIKKIVKKAYSNNFDHPEIAPLVHLKDNEYILELWHGPTLAFKDLALQIMPLFFSEVIKRQKKPLHYLILVATSGDTGKAALEGFKDKENISINVFYPKGYVSKMQELQMTTQEGANVSVFSIEGDFDTTQKLVKDILNDKEFAQKLYSKSQTILSSANSINWGRLIPQIIYHLNSYLQLVNKNVIRLGEEIDIAVPTGNFGNILAAYYAKLAGVPIRKLICASNENNAVAKFLQNGIYDINKSKLVKTPSPAMDILVASNIERLLYAITNDSETVSYWMNELRKKGKFEVDNTTKAILRKIFYADWVINKDCLINIKRIYKKTNYLMDPHTSVGQLIAERYIKQYKVLRPVVICSTAHWSKFAKEIGKLATQSLPKSISDLKEKKIRHNKGYGANIKEVEDAILNQIQYIHG